MPDQKKQSPGGSRLQGFYFRLHPLMSDELGAEITSDVFVVHYCDRWIVFVRQDTREGSNASGEIRGMAHHGRASLGVDAASARSKALI